MTPRPLSKSDSASLEILVRGLVDPCEEDGPSSRRIGESDGVFMPLVVERLGPVTYALTHYYKQNGDMMRDPDVEFFRDSEGRWFPIRFRQDGGVPMAYKVIEIGPAGIEAVYRQRYTSLREFVRVWLANLREQHGIV